MTQDELKSAFEKILNEPAPPHLYYRRSPLGYLKKDNMTLLEAMIARACIAVASGRKFDTSTFENIMSRVAGKVYGPKRGQEENPNAEEDFQPPEAKSMLPSKGESL